MNVRQDMRRISSRGFTLIEILIALVIVGVLSAIAINNYTKSVQKSNRADAKTALTQLQAQEEAYRFSGTSYTTLANLPWATQMGLGTQSKNKLYNLSITPAAPSSTFTITATATGSQTKDTDCQTFSINYLGVQQAYNSGGTANTTSCWGG